MVKINNFVQRYGFYFVIILGLMVYTLNSTHSALWYDEAVEYFYSKVLVGEVPGGFGKLNMYERICNTYQPPLYNVIMYVWLQLFDFGEFSFRFAGIIFTFIGAIGIYKSIGLLCGKIYALLGCAIYIFTSKVYFYALECAEYNLMLCCVSWMVFYFLNYIEKKNRCFLFGFFVFAVLSVYSQYGSAFMAFALWLIILYSSYSDKEKLFDVLIGTVITIIFAVLPLVYYFLIPQMTNQGSISNSHNFVFRKNIIVDYVLGIKIILSFIFSSVTRLSRKILRILPLVMVMCFGLMSLFACYKTKKNYLLLVVAGFLSYTFYFLAVALSFYGYMGWIKTLGTYNLGYRYCLFFIPLIVVTIVYGCYLFFESVKHIKIKKYLQTACICLVVSFVGIGIHDIFVNWEKDDIREVTKIWYANKGYNIPTVVHQWSDANFQFYLHHWKEYKDEYNELIRTAGIWIRNTKYDEMNEQLNKMGIFENKKMYYVGPCRSYLDSYKVFTDVVKNKGYRVNTLYKKQSALLLCEKD